MSGYIGTQPVPQATQTRDSFTATSGQTSFATGGYTPNFLDVYLNGVKLSAADYTASNGSDVVLASGAATGDILEVVAFTTFTPASIPDGTPSIDDNGDATAITIDSSERVMLGITSPFTNPSSTNDGVTFGGAYTWTQVSDAGGQYVQRQNDGKFFTFFKGTGSGSVGSIGTVGNQSYIHGAGTDVGIYFGSNNLYPYRSTGLNDATIDLGQSAKRFKDAYLSGGVYLGGTGSANKLDDYEEGTWTPILGGSTGTSGQSYSTQHGSYTKIGRVVHLQAYVVMASIGTSTGAYGQVQNLPFTAAPVQGYGGGIFQYFNLIGGTSVSQLIAYPEGNSTFAYVLYTAGAGTTTSYLGGGGWGSAPQVMLSMTYLTNA